MKNITKLLSNFFACLLGNRAASENEAAQPHETENLRGQIPRQLESLVPVSKTIEERVRMATLCRDADHIPKVPNAGAVVETADGTKVQIMHNGIPVLAGGYYGDWMQDLIQRCKGHHEPQEECLFHELMKHIDNDATMIELGGFWSFYSIWFLTKATSGRSIIVEPEPEHIKVGKTNAQLNNCEPVFINAFAGKVAAALMKGQTEVSGEVEIPCASVPQLMEDHQIEKLDLLHCDAQGIELDVLESCAELINQNRLNWLVVSTHVHYISGDPLTHQRCLAFLQNAGATIIAEHDVYESFSGDGLIVAKFGELPDNWVQPNLSYNRYSTSLFRNPLYDLAAQGSQAE